MNKITLKGNVTGKFFVQNKGFVAVNQVDATKFATNDEAADVQDCLAMAGAEVSTQVELKATSFAVTYIRKNALDANGKVSQKPLDANKGEIDPSKRRFATRNEAIVHGSNFWRRRAKAGDPEGTAGHIGFYVTETTDPVNSSVNPLTGLTNSL